MGTMRIVGIVGLIVSLILGVLYIVGDVKARYEYKNTVSYAWSLADKTSTLEAKSAYMDEFVNNLNKAHLAEYDAIIFKTPDNNVANNIKALITLRDRLNEIKGLDPESFAYQTAIQQITAQEQGEANEMIGVIEGGWFLKNHPLFWGWISGIIWLLFMIAGTVSYLSYYRR